MNPFPFAPHASGNAHGRHGPGIRWVWRRLIPIGLWLSSIGRLIGAPTEADLRHRFQSDVLPFLESYCDSCHAREKPKGDFDLRSFRSMEAVLSEERRWKGVLSQVRDEQMPPEEARRQPTDPERQRFVGWIRELRALDAHRHAGDPGLVTARRLNQAEYDNSIRDLTGADIRPAREFPIDPANEAGFDNSGESLAMSPSLLKKYFEAGRRVTEHLLLTPTGFTFASYPIVSETDREKFCVRRIIDFYQRQPTNVAAYLITAWEFDHRQRLSPTPKSLSELAQRRNLSAQYLDQIWTALKSTPEQIGPMAALQKLYKELPTEPGSSALVRTNVEAMAELISRIRTQVRVNVPTLRVNHMNAGTQAFVLWKDREMARQRRDYGGGALNLTLEALRVPSDHPASACLRVPSDEVQRAAYEDSFRRFCSLFPDAFYISERGRVFLDNDEDKNNTGRFLSAGFHNQMGYFRDDQPLYDLILDESGRRELDRLWQEFEFSCELPMRMHSGGIWFDRAESDFGTDPEFAFAHPADRDVVSESKFRQYAEVFTAKLKRLTTDPTVLASSDQHFKISEANIRRVEKEWRESESHHLDALQEFAGRAYRRRLSPSEREEITAFYRHLRNEEGAGHAEAVRDTLVSIILSPHFCYRLDLPMARTGASDTTVAPLSDAALASRLSYFLWASTPDAELLQHAASGDLHQPAILRAQVQRLLRDSKVRGWATEFGGNWLDFRRFEEHNAVDRSRFPSFDHELRSAMFEEPIRLLMDVAQDDRSVLDLLEGSDTWLNVPLARHYGVPIPGTEIPASTVWWKLDDARYYGRGGLLPMAVFQTRNSPGLRTSPVKRGYWVVRRLLGEEIPPPPAKVPELPSDESKLGELTLRQTLERHRSEKACSGCHARFDSIGLAFEGFGPIGELRKLDLAGHPVDTRAVFPGGMEGAGVDGVRDYIRKHRTDDFLDNFSRKLLAYGLGRTLQLSDDLTIEAMREDAMKNGYRFSRLIEAIVLSPQFLNQRRSIEVTGK